MEIPKLTLKLPDEGVDQLLHIKIRLLRVLYIKLMGVIENMLPNGQHMVDTLRGYDWPRNKEYCLWYEILKGYKDDTEVNPMWCIDYVMRRRIGEYGIPALEKFIDKSLRNQFIEHGAQLHFNAVVGVRASLHVITVQFNERCSAYRVPATHMYASFFQDNGVDPILQCLWMWKNNIDLTYDLRQAAAIAYACNPQAYAHPSYPDGWFSKCKFTDYFNVKVKTDGEFTAPDVSRILS